MTSVEQWIGAYYPHEMILDQRSKAILCLLFDKIVCHFPVSDMTCGGGSGMSECFSDDPLVKSGVVELREEVLLSEVQVNFAQGHYWGTEEEFNQFVELQITAMALNTCVDHGAVPVTDSPNWPIPASLARKADLVRFAHIQAAALAVQSLEVAIPPIAELVEDDILEARVQLREQLVPFRRSMLALAPIVRDGIQSEASLGEIYEEAKYVVETNVAPALYELHDRLSKEKGRFWRKLIIKGSGVIPKFVLNWTTKGALLAAIDSLGDVKDLTLEVVEREALLASLKSHGALGYLLSVADHPSFKSKGKKL